MSSTPRNSFGLVEEKILVVSADVLTQSTWDYLRRGAPDLDDGVAMSAGEDLLIDTRHRYEHGEAVAEAFGSGPNGKSLMETFPDLALLQAFGRGSRATVIRVMNQSDPEFGFLPRYDTQGEIIPPTQDDWRKALSETGENLFGCKVIIPSWETLEQIEAGQTPMPAVAHAHDAPGM